MTNIEKKLTEIYRRMFDGKCYKNNNEEYYQVSDIEVSVRKDNKTEYHHFKIRLESADEENYPNLNPEFDFVLGGKWDSTSLFSIDFIVIEQGICTEIDDGYPCSEEDWLTVCVL